MRQLLFFSNNKNKIIEIKKIFKKFNLELLSLNDLNISDEPEETGKTFEENAKIKSDYGFNKTGIPCFADDSGICIESLSWKPGVLSKRFLNNFKSNQFDIYGKEYRVDNFYLNYFHLNFRMFQIRILDKFKN